MDVSLTFFFYRRQLEINAAAAGLFLLIYDYILILPLEIKHVWKARWTPVKFLYLLARYSAFVDIPLTLTLGLLEGDPNPTLCRSLYNFIAWNYVIGLLAGDALLMWRTWAIWNSNRCFGIAIIMFLAGSCIFVIVALVKYTSSHQWQSLAGYPVCFSSDSISGTWPIFVTQAVIEAAILISTLARYFCTTGDRKGPCLFVLYRDGVLFTVFTLATTLINIIALVAFPDEVGQMAITLERVMHALLCCRVVLHLRATVVPPVVGGGSTEEIHWRDFGDRDDRDEHEARQDGRT